MAGTGMALRRGNNHTAEPGDDVQSSIELLDRVLSEFDDMENANQVQNIQQLVGPLPVPLATNTPTTTPGNVSSTPEDESPSLGGHQSEDDGYMSMNGRKPKFALSFKPLTEDSAHHETVKEQDFPPPPEEAERLIATLLPRVSPANSAKRNSGRRSRTQIPAVYQVEEISHRQCWPVEMNHVNTRQVGPIHSATQTTIPKTRHQRPYGWESHQFPNNFHLHPSPFPFGSLPYSHTILPLLSPQRFPHRTPPRTVPTSVDRHREVRRCNDENLSDEENTPVRQSEDLADDERFSDDSLEEMLLPPPPPMPNKRGSIAWEVPLDQDEAMLTPGSTKVVGRRRRKSGENSQSSTSSIPNRLKDLDDWPEPPPSNTEDEVVSPFSDSDDPIILPEELARADLSGSGTYIIRRGKKDRKQLNNLCSSPTSNSSLNSRLSSDLSLAASRLSTELNMPNSRYSLDLSTPQSRSPRSRFSLDLGNKDEEEFKKHSATLDNIKSLANETDLVRVISLPTLSAEDFTPRRELTVTVEEEEETSAEVSPLRKIEKNISELLERKDLEVFLNQASKSEKFTTSSSLDFPVNVEIFQHDFPPLPPTPVEEDDEEYDEISPALHIKSRADTLPVILNDSRHLPLVPPHRDSISSSLKTRNVNRTLPMDLPGTKRRTFNCKRSCQSPREERHMQTSCSLPETPIFARGCDIPRTPHRRAPEVPGHRTTPRQSSTMGMLNTLGSMSTGSSFRRDLSNSKLEQALAGAEMLRLAGGPGRGWYPRHRHPRPASIEHLDRLAPGHSHGSWDAGSRKPLTLPPNLTPKFFQKSPREALRRVTSLLIRKGNNGKESKKEKEHVQQSNIASNNEDGPKKKGFFKNLWKRSRHYSLEQQ